MKNEWETRSAYRVLGELEGKRLLGRLRCGLEDNSEMVHREIGGWRGLN
jgi:hypothetical protein